MTAITLAECGIFQTDNFSVLQKQRSSSLKLKNVRIEGKRTSMRLEPEFWAALKEVARREGRSQAAVCAQAVRDCPGSVTSAVRVYILKKLTGIGEGTQK